jgi:hypothetical protein
VGEKQSYHRLQVQSQRKDRHELVKILTKGRESTRVLWHVSTLRQLDEGQTLAKVAGSVGVARKTVRATARRYEEHGTRTGDVRRAQAR